jgi:hypothetical protein
MFHRKARGTVVVELGKSVGGTMSMLGAIIAVKAAIEAANANPVYSFGEVELFNGDLYLPFTNNPGALWCGIILAGIGTITRLLAYLKLWEGKL